MKKATKKEHFNDLLLPVILVLGVLPFVVYMAEYDNGYSKYDWHSDQSVMQDFYTYYRAIFFIVIAFFAVVILAFWLGLYREQVKNSKIFIPLAVYGVCAVVSAIASKHPKAAWLGNFVDCEGTFVLLGYAVIGFYTYQMLRVERDYRTILRAVLVMFTPMSVVGWFQVFQNDLLNYEWVQKLVMSDALYAEYGGVVEDVFSGNNVFLTLYNPNFAAIFLVMFAAVFAVFLLEAGSRKERIFYGVFLTDALILCWFTYTRAALVALLVVAVMLCVCLMGQTQEENRRKLRGIIIGGVGFFAVLLIVDAVCGGKYIGRLIDESKEQRLEAIVTTADGVEITYEGAKYLVSLKTDGQTDAICVRDESGEAIALAKLNDGDYLLPFSEDGRADVILWEEKPQMILFIDGMTLQFEQRAAGYYYYAEWGKCVSMEEIPHVDMGGLEYLGSGRVYIWSRILPMLPKYLLLGSGPDTFAEVYPQNDYVGKMIYAEYAGRIIERAHNDFLMRWVQTGFVSLAAVLVFYVLFLKKSFMYYRGCALESVKDKLGFGCFLGCVGYLVCCFFSDSTLYTTPIFYVFVGIALSAEGK